MAAPTINGLPVEFSTPFPLMTCSTVTALTLPVGLHLTPTAMTYAACPTAQSRRARGSLQVRDEGVGRTFAERWLHGETSTLAHRARAWLRNTIACNARNPGSATQWLTQAHHGPRKRATTAQHIMACIRTQEQ